jgi:hypothetical protein
LQPFLKFLSVGKKENLVLDKQKLIYLHNFIATYFKHYKYVN